MLTYRQAMFEAGRQYCRCLLELTDGNVAHAAKIAGRNRTDFYRTLQRYGLQGSGDCTPPRYRSVTELRATP